MTTPFLLLFYQVGSRTSKHLQWHPFLLLFRLERSLVGIIFLLKQLLLRAKKKKKNATSLFYRSTRIVFITWIGSAAPFSRTSASHPLGSPPCYYIYFWSTPTTPSPKWITATMAATMYTHWKVNIHYAIYYHQCALRLGLNDSSFVCFTTS